MALYLDGKEVTSVSKFTTVAKAELAGLYRVGKVTTATSDTIFESTDLRSQDDDAFPGWYVYVLQSDGAAPEGELQPMSDYDSSDGKVTHTAFTQRLDVGDWVVLLHPSISMLGEINTAAATGAVGNDKFLMAYQKQLVTFNRLMTEIADGLDVFPASVAEDSLWAKVLGKGNPALGTSFNNTTDSLEAIRDAIDALVAIAATDKGVTQTLELAVTSAADAVSDTLLGTVASGSVIVTKVVVFAVTTQTGNMTNAAVKGGAAQVLTFIDAADLVQADVDAADKQVAWSGEMRLNTGDTIVMEHTGTGAAALDLVVAFTFHASSADGATMS